MRKDQFMDWMEKATSLAPSTIKSYAGAINTVSKGLKKYNAINGNLYNIHSATEVESLTLKYFTISEFLEKDSRGNKMYSNALKYYKKYVAAEEKK